MDISYKDDKGAGCLLVYNPQTQLVVYSDYEIHSIDVPYIPGYLSYREMPIYRSLLSKLKRDHSELFPEVILVDGHGRFHPRHCGSACTVGLEFDCPTIGVGKNMFCGEAFITPGKRSVVMEDACDVCSNIHECKRVFSEALKQNKRIVVFATAQHIGKYSTLRRDYWSQLLPTFYHKAYFYFDRTSS